MTKGPKNDEPADDAQLTRQARTSDGLREQRTKTVKAVRVCPKCQGFMVPKGEFRTASERRDFTSDHQLRSFGGIELKTFICEKCHYSSQFQVDPFPKGDDF